MVCSHGVAPCSSALLCVLLLVFIVTMTTGKIRTHETECLREGGICVEENACPLEKMVNKTGLCPEQEDKGAVCCNGVPDTELLCRQNGGECGGADACANVKSFGRLDCKEGTECCLLIF